MNRSPENFSNPASRATKIRASEMSNLPGHRQAIRGIAAHIVKEGTGSISYLWHETAINILQKTSVLTSSATGQKKRVIETVSLQPPKNLNSRLSVEYIWSENDPQKITIFEWTKAKDGTNHLTTHIYTLRPKDLRPKDFKKFRLSSTEPRLK